MTSEARKVRHQELWLSVESGSRKAIFTFEPESDNTVLFGSVPNAQFQLTKGSPLAFYVERREDALVLVPAYVDTGIRFNTQKLTDWVCISDRAIVEVGTHRLKLTVRALPPTVPPPRLEQSSAELPFAELPEPDSGAVTVIRQCSDELPTHFVHATATDPVHEAATMALHAPSEASASSAEPLADFGNTQFMGSLQEFEVDDPDPSDSKVDEEEKTSITGSRWGAHAADESTKGIPLDEFLPPSRSHPRAPHVGIVQADYDELAKSGCAQPAVGTPHSSADKSRTPTRDGFKTELRRQMVRLGVYAKHRPVIALTVMLALGGVVSLSVAGATVLLRGAPHEVAVPLPNEETSVLEPEPTFRPAEAIAEVPVRGNPPTVTSAVAEAAQTPALRQTSALSHALTQEASKALTAKEKAALKLEEARVAAEEAKVRAAIDQAIRHMIAGRYDEASAAYRELARTHQDVPELARMASLMERHRNANAAGSAETTTLPDIYP